MTKAEKINIAIGISQLLIAVLLFLGWDRKSMPDFLQTRTWLILLLNFGGWVFVGYAVYLSNKRARQNQQVSETLKQTVRQLEDQCKETSACQRELYGLYADVVLDWLQQNHPMVFTVAHVAKKMRYDEAKIAIGLEILEKEFKVVQNNGLRGWTYSPMSAVSLISQLRRLIPHQDSN